MEELDLTGMRLEQAEWAGNILSANFGDGYAADAVTGATSGLHTWSLRSGGVWPDVTTYGLTIDGHTRFEYYWEFFKRHTTGTTRIFIIEFRDKKYHASFVDPSMTAERMTKLIQEPMYQGGVQIRQRRIPGGEYDTDGAIVNTMLFLGEAMEFLGEEMTFGS